MRQIRFLFLFIVAMTLHWSCESDLSNKNSEVSISKPTRVTATAADAQVSLSWDEVEQATSYNIYWGTESQLTKNSQKIENGTRPYVHSDLNNGTTYYYAITAENSDGDSELSEEVSATPKEAATAPSAPTNLTATAGDAQITLDWDAATGATTYNLYWSTTSDVAKSSTKVESSSPPYTDSAVANGTTYYYAVSAANSIGESSLSQEVFATPTAAASPTTPTTPTTIISASKLSITSGPSSVMVGSCSSKLTVQRQSSESTSVSTGTISVTLTDGSESASFYSDANCATTITSTTIANTTSSADFYVKGTTVEKTISIAAAAQGLTSASQNITVTLAKPFPQHTTYASGIIQPSSWSQDELDQDVKTLYDDWKGDYLKTAGTHTDESTLYRVALGHSGDNADITVSEGQGYGMLITALMAGYDSDAQAIFDGLWNFARNQDSNHSEYLMDYKTPADNPSIHNSAFDGDADIAYAMLLADVQWGSGGTINYLNEAKQVIAAINSLTIGPNSRLPMLGDWVPEESAGGVSSGTYHEYTVRGSDFMPSHFRAFKSATDDDTWDTVRTNCQDVVTSIQTNYSSTTGLIPDFMIPESGTTSPLKPAGANFLETEHDGKFHTNSSRLPWRLALDVLLNGDNTTKTQLQNMTTWLKGASAANGVGSAIKAGYDLDGTVTGNYYTWHYAGSFAVAAMVDSDNQDWLNSIYTCLHNYVDHVADNNVILNCFGSEENYFEETVGLLNMLAISSNYWAP